MADLATLQRQLFGLVKATHEVSPTDDPYICMVAQSKNLVVLQDIIRLWQLFGMEQYCPLTSTLLRRRDLFDTAVSSFVSKGPVSPFIDEAGPMFLVDLGSHADPLVVALARFELALTKVKQGDPAEYVIDWPYQPYDVLAYLLSDAPLDEKSMRGPYQTVVSANLPHFFEVFFLQEDAG